VADESLLPDGTNIFLGGQDSSKFPDLLSPETYAAGVNITVQKGSPAPRWGLDKLPLDFSGAGDIDVGNNILIPFAEIFKAGRYQHRAAYSIGADFYILVVIAGIIYLINIDTFAVTVISLPDGDTLNENSPRLNGENADKYYVIHDYPNFPVILDGITAFRADPALYEVPVSVIGAYNQNRLFIANAGADVTAGDPTGSLATPLAPISFEEVEAPSAPFFGQIFSLPTNTLNPEITAMTFLEFTDTSTGIGPLIVATANQIFSANAQNPRNTWEAGSFITALTSSSGIAGPRAYVHVNSDLFFFGSDGQLRTLSMSRNEQTKWSQTPISREVENWLVYNNPDLVKYSVLGYYKNKVFVSTNPHYVSAYSRDRTPIFDVANGGFAVLELDNMATLGKDTQPAWAGLWTGCRPMDIVTVNNRCFVISKDDSFINNIYEINTKQTFDTDSDGTIRYVNSSLYTKEYDCKSPYQNKAVHSMVLGLRNVKGDFQINVDYKPSHGSQFVKWAEFKHNAPWRVCGVPQGCLFNGLVGHSFRDLTIGDPFDPSCDPVSQTTYNIFRKVQLKFTLVGIYWELRDYLLLSTAQPQGQQINACDENYAPVPLCSQCNSDWYIGPFKSCSIPKT